MAMPNERVTSMTDREPLAVKVARIEEGQKGIAGDVADIKAAVEQLGKRVTYLAEVKVGGLENREIARQAVEAERARAADAAREAAERAAAEAATHAQGATLRLTRWQVWLGGLGGLAMAASVVISAIALLH